MNKIERLKQESEEIRKFLIEVTSRNGGHLAPNLGVVELTQALIESFDLPNDKILFDVGHQSYVYKILTDRRERFASLRLKDGLGPFTDPKESKYDFFLSGHAGSALSAGAGIAKAFPNNKVVVVIGDASIANGQSLEALNHIGEDIDNLIVILNDNDMSIGKNVGSLSKFFGRFMTSNIYMNTRKDIRGLIDKISGGESVKGILERMENSLKQFFLPLSVSEALGYRYLGVIDGHNIEELLNVFEKAKKIKGAVFIHIKTEKGKGFSLAEEDKEKFHGISPFDLETGEVEKSGETYSDIFGNKMIELAKKDEDIYAISAAMIKGTGLGKFQKLFESRCIDVGIAEEHAVGFAGGLAISGKKPYVAIYSTFFQRTFDQLIHDIGLQNLPVRFIIDRAGIVGEDGKTHQGIHDINIFLTMSNFKLLAPATAKELQEMLDFTKDYNDFPIAIRFPRGKAYNLENDKEENFEFGKWKELKKGEKVLFLTTGAMIKEILEIQNSLNEREIFGTVVNCSTIRPLDEGYLTENLPNYDYIFTLEDGYKRGGFGNEVLKFINEKKMNVNIEIIALDEEIIPHGTRKELLEEYGISGERLIKRIEESINGKK